MKEIKNIEDLTLSDFYSRDMNEVFIAHNDEHFLTDGNGNIGFKIEVIDSTGMSDKIEYTMMEETLGKAFEKYDIIVGAVLTNVIDIFYEPRTSSVIMAFFRKFRSILEPPRQSSFDEKSEIYYQKAIQDAKTMEDVVGSFDYIEEIFSNEI